MQQVTNNDATRQRLRREIACPAVSGIACPAVSGIDALVASRELPQGG